MRSSSAETQRYRAEMVTFNFAANEEHVKQLKKCVDYMKLQKQQREKLAKAGKEKDAKVMAEYESKKLELLQLTKKYVSNKLIFGANCIYCFTLM